MGEKSLLWRIHDKMDRTAAAVQSICQRRQGKARIEMRLFGEEQRAAETAGKVGFKFGDLRLVEPVEALSTFGKARQFDRISRGDDDQAALAHRARKVPRPPADPGVPERKDDGGGIRALAPRSKHATRHPRAA